MKSFAFILVLTVMTGPALACGWHGGGVWGGFNPAGAERKPYNPSSEEDGTAQAKRPNFSLSINDEIIAEAQARLAEMNAKIEAEKSTDEKQPESKDSDLTPAE